jgi:hypothetical protein
MSQSERTLHSLTHHAIETLQLAYGECTHTPVEGKILSAIVTVKQVHDMLDRPECTEFLDPEEYCAAI